MRALFQSTKNKKALSNIVGYVLLISITLSLSVLVYGWLKFYVSGDDIETCPNGVNIIIKDYECVSTVLGGEDGYLTLTFKNKGLFTVDGYLLRVHDRQDADFGFYTFDETGAVIKPGEEYIKTYNFDENIINGYKLKQVTTIEVQPFIMEEDQINCKVYTSQKISCE